MRNNRPVLRRAAAGLAACAALAGPAATRAEPAAAPQVDHHMHIFSPEASRILNILCVRAGPQKCPPEISKAPSTGADAIRALDAAGVRQGVLLSTAYFFASPDVADLHLPLDQETRAENRYVVDQARLSCGRLAAFISVNPAAPNAVREIDYWAHAGGATGLKLHLGNSGFDFRSPAEVRKLAAVFRAAGRAGFPIVIHLQTRRSDYGAADARIFLREVAPFAGDVPIQVAHAAGGGGVDGGELAALGAFADAFERRPQATRNIFFDLAMVPDEVSNTDKLAAAPDKVAALKALIARIGLRRFAPGSDWTSGLDLAHYYADERAALALPDADWAALSANKAPYMHDLAAAAADCAAKR